jgi:uncharacterized protein YcbK (DUF882 family)
MAYSQEHEPATTEQTLSRRCFLTFGVLAATAGLIPLPGLAHTTSRAGVSSGSGSRSRKVSTGARAETPARGTTPVTRSRHAEARGRRPPAVPESRRAEISVRMRQRSPSVRRTEHSAYVRYEEPSTYLHSAARPEKSLAIYNPHTGEGLRTVYWFRGKYLTSALRDFDYLLRDYRANEVKSIDLQLLDLLYSMSTMLETNEPFYVISGYRSPSTNAMLRLSNAGVAEHSLHIEGKAADIRLPGRDASYIRRAAVTLQAGGVGYYPYSKFVHVDTGPVRYW